MNVRVADYIMNCLSRAGVYHVFQVTGRGSLFLSDALAKNKNLMPISLHHEQSCAFAAVAYAEKNQSVGACLVSTGCAATNAISGVLSAWQDGVPCVFLSGQNSLRQTTKHTGVPLRTYGQQEANIVEIVRPITKFAHMLEAADDITSVMEDALKAALTGRQGPVWLDIPLDLQSSIIVQSVTPDFKQKQKKTSDYVRQQARTVAQELRDAQRPVILIGKGVRWAGAESLLVELVQRWKIPLAYTSSAPDVYGASNKLSVGSVGVMGCSRAGNFTVQNADYLLVLGSRLSSLTTGNDYLAFAREARITVVDIDPAEHSKEGIQIHRLIAADLQPFLHSLLSEPAQDTSLSWINKCLHWKKIFSHVEANFDSKDAIDLYQLSAELSRCMPAETTLITDSGLIEIILPNNIRFPPGVNCIHPTSQGAMGFALPAAIGAQYASKKLVLAVIGDGSIMMNLQELQSIYHHNLPIKVIVINNNGYAIIRRRQKELFRERTTGTDSSNGLSCPNFASIAQAFGFPYERISSVSELREKLTQLLAHPSFVLCEIMGRPEQDYIEVGLARSKVGNRLVRRPLEDQRPYLPRDVFANEMVVGLAND